MGRHRCRPGRSGTAWVRRLAAACVIFVFAASLCGQDSVRGARRSMTRHATVRLSNLPGSWAIPGMRPQSARYRPSVQGSAPLLEIARQRVSPLPLAPEAGHGAMLLSPFPVSSFAALGDDDTVIPPDTCGAVGRSHLMEALNSQIQLQDRAGVVSVKIAMATFWEPFTPQFVFDPVIRYDPFADRWIFSCVSDAALPSAALFVAVTDTGDPSGGWELYGIDADPGDQVFFDHPQPGFNKDWIVVQTNVFDVGGTNDFRGSKIFALNKSELYAGIAGSFTAFTMVDQGSDQIPARTYDDSLSTAYLVQDYGSNDAGEGRLRLYSITGSIGSEELSIGPFVTSPDAWDSSSPDQADFAPQLDSARKIQCGDSRIANVVYRDGSLWAAHTVFLPPGGAPTRSAIQWWQVTPAGSIKQRGRIEDGAGKSFYAFPSIAVNKDGDVLVGYSRFSATQYASANYSFRRASDPPGTMRADVVLKPGEASYYKTLDSSLNRWGDYSATVVDPLNDRDMWTIQEYAAKPVAGTDQWGTWWGRVDPDVLPTTCSGRAAEALTSVHPTAASRSVTGSLRAARSNAYAFEACDAATFSFSFCTAPGSAGFDSWLCLFDDSGTLVSENDNVCGAASELTAALSPGSYFVAVSAAAPNLAGAYTLSFSAGSSNCFRGVSSVACGCGAMGGLDLTWNNPADAQAADTILVRLNDDPARSFTAPGTSASFHIEADDLSSDVVRVSVTNASGMAVSCDVPGACAGGRQIPGDCNQDGKLDISDGVCVLGFFFLGRPTELPCGDGQANDPANRALLDLLGDGRLDLTDAVNLLSFLFLGGAPHVLLPPDAPQRACIRITGCGTQAACQ